MLSFCILLPVGIAQGVLSKEGIIDLACLLNVVLQQKLSSFRTSLVKECVVVLASVLWGCCMDFEGSSEFQSKILVVASGTLMLLHLQLPLYGALLHPLQEDVPPCQVISPEPPID